MSSDWDEILAFFKKMQSRKSRYAIHFSGIVELIPKICENLAFKDIVPRTSLATLYLTLPDKSPKVAVFYEGEQKYSLYILRGQETVLEDIQATTEDITQKLAELVIRLRKEY